MLENNDNVRKIDRCEATMYEICISLLLNLNYY